MSFKRFMEFISSPTGEGLVKHFSNLSEKTLDCLHEQEILIINKLEGDDVLAYVEHRSAVIQSMVEGSWSTSRTVEYADESDRVEKLVVNMNKAEAPEYQEVAPVYGDIIGLLNDADEEVQSQIFRTFLNHERFREMASKRDEEKCDLQKKLQDAEKELEEARQDPLNDLFRIAAQVMESVPENGGSQGIDALVARMTSLEKRLKGMKADLKGSRPKKS